MVYSCFPVSRFRKMVPCLVVNISSGIDTSKTLLERKKEEERNSENNNNFLLEPLLALTLTQTEAVSSLHKCDIPTQLYLSGKLGIPEAIL